MPETSTPVLIIRLDAIGDALALAPLLAALRDRAIPVDLVMSPGNARIFAPRAAHEIFVAPFSLRSSGRENLAAIREFAARLATRSYSQVLVATEDPGGYRLARDTHAPTRIGFANTWGKPLKRLWVGGLLTQTISRTAGLDASAPHECQVLFSLGRGLLGPEAEPTRSIGALRPLVVEAEPAPDDRVLVQVTDKWRRLGIADDSVVAAIARARESGHALRLVASRAEWAYAREISEATRLDVERFDDVVPWKAAIAAARAVLAPDSGAVHVAGTIGTPVVAVFPQSRQFSLQSARWAPWAAPSRIVEAAAEWPQRAVAALGELAGAPR
ncbi:MAG: glycosyltransferase family 9 protein [Vulcanimicrobiaceae bacterium]